MKELVFVPKKRRAAAILTAVGTRGEKMCDDVEDLHRSACAREEETYVDPSSGLTVFTAYAHLQRGKCESLS